MEFLFFNAADMPLFVRDDSEQADWTADQLSLFLLFPYNPDKVIQRGMRIGFQYDDIWQVFEARKVKTYEPDHYQEITAEHIAIAELTDTVYDGSDITDQTAQETLAPMLVGTGWAIGNVTDSSTSSVDLSIGNVWANIRAIEQNWNVLVEPRITVGANGITGKYLDIRPNEGVWRGVRLSLEKNADDVGVTYDDTNVKTALYGFGAMTEDGNEKNKLTFASVAWEATQGHPAKPLNQTYIEDPQAKAAFSRNGVNRFGFYQNSNIKNAEILLQKTWETLQTLNKPSVTIDCTVTDLHRLGYADQDIRLHDKVIVEIQPVGLTLTLDVIKLEIDLLDPTRTRPTIGQYIPNIIYISRETGTRARGGYGGGYGQTENEYKLDEFSTEIGRNEQEIRQRAYQTDLDSTNQSVLNAYTELDLQTTQISSIVTGSGVQLDANGNLIVDAQGNPVFITTGGGLYSKIHQNEMDISLKVSNGEVATQLAVECGNVSITGGNLIVDGYLEANGITTAAGGTLTADTLEARYGEIDTVNALTVATNSVTGCDSFTMNAYSGDLVDSIKSVQVIASGNDYKLQYKTFSGDTWTDAGTFSRATLMSGTWASGVLTVLPDNAGSSSLYYYLSQGNTSWNGAYGSIPVLYSTEQSGQTQSTGYTFSVYRGGSITAASPVSQQPTGSNLRTVTVGTGGNHSYIKLSSTGYRNNNDYITINY